MTDLSRSDPGDAIPDAACREPASWSQPDPAMVGVVAGVTAALLVLLRFIGGAPHVLALGLPAALCAADLVHCLTGELGFLTSFPHAEAAVIAVTLFGPATRIEAVRLARVAGIDLEAITRDTTH